MRYHLLKSTCNFVENLSLEKYLVVLVRYVGIFDWDEKKVYGTVPYGTMLVYKKLPSTNYKSCSQVVFGAAPSPCRIP